MRAATAAATAGVVTAGVVTAGTDEVTKIGSHLIRLEEYKKKKDFVRSVHDLSIDPWKLESGFFSLCIFKRPSTTYVHHSYTAFSKNNSSFFPSLCIRPCVRPY